MELIFGPPSFRGPYAPRTGDTVIAPVPKVAESHESYSSRLRLWARQMLDEGVSFWETDEALGHFLSQRITMDIWSRDAVTAIAEVRAELDAWIKLKFQLAESYSAVGNLEAATDFRLHIYHHDRWPGHSLRERLRVDLVKLGRFEDAISLMKESLVRRRKMLKPDVRAIESDERHLAKLEAAYLRSRGCPS